MTKKRIVSLALAVIFICGTAKIWAEKSTPTEETKTKPTVEVKSAPTTEAKPQSNKAINWKELAKFLPEEIKGMKAGDLDGGTFTMADPSNPDQQFSYSTVERDFTTETKEGNDKEIDISIMDSGLNQMMMMPYTMMMEYDTPDGSMKTTEIKGHKAMLIVESDEGKLESHQIIMPIGNRLLVSVQGNELTTLDEITKLAESIDYDKLVKLTE